MLPPECPARAARLFSDFLDPADLAALAAVSAAYYVLADFELAGVPEPEPEAEPSPDGSDTVQEDIGPPYLEPSASAS